MHKNFRRLAAAAVGCVALATPSLNAHAASPARVTEPIPPPITTRPAGGNLTPEQLKQAQDYDRKLRAYVTQKANDQLGSGVRTLSWEGITAGQYMVTLSWSSGSSAIGVGHAAIVSRNTAQTVEAYGWPAVPAGYNAGVQRYPSGNWAGNHPAWRLRPNDMTPSQFWYAAIDAEARVGKPYNYNFANKWDEGRFYCSQLVWRAWVDNGHTLTTWVENNLPYVSPAMLMHGNVRILQQY